MIHFLGLAGLDGHLINDPPDLKEHFYRVKIISCLFFSTIFIFLSIGNHAGCGCGKDGVTCVTPLLRSGEYVRA